MLSLVGYAIVIGHVVSDIL